MKNLAVLALLLPSYFSISNQQNLLESPTEIKFNGPLHFLRNTDAKILNDGDNYPY